MVRRRQYAHKPRRFRRRRRNNKLATVGAVKRLLSRKVETKALYLGINDIDLGNRYVYAYQPFWQIAKGTASHQRIGASIRDVTLRLSLAYTYLGNNPTGDTRLGTGGPLRCLIVRTPRDMTNKATVSTAWTSITATAGTGDDIPLFLNSSSPATSLVDINSDVKIVKQFWLHSSQPTTSLIGGDTVFKQVSIRIPKYEYDELTGSGRTYNYYVMVVAQGNKAMPLNGYIGSLQSHMLVTWKDA